MKISTKGRYAVSVLIDLALHDTGEYITIRDISARTGITVKYLEQIVSSLNKAGYLKSMRGNAGGYRLLKAPSEVVVGDILRTMEGNLTPVECLGSDGDGCPMSESCPSISFWVGLDKVVNEYIDSYTLQDLADMSRRDYGYDYSI